MLKPAGKYLGASSQVSGIRGERIKKMDFMDMMDYRDNIVTIS